MSNSTSTIDGPLLIDEVAGHGVEKLATEFGTPLYVYDAAQIVERCADLAAFDVVRYAQKACANLAIIDLIRRQGGMVDAVSAGEIERALAAGYQPGPGHPPQIVFTADLFDQETLDLVVQHDIPVNCGSPDMIDQYGQRCRGREITLRLNPGFGHGHSQKTNTGGASSKHGIWHEQLEECLARAERFELTIAGLHMHIGSGTDMEHLSEVCGAMASAAGKVGASITTISAGGGLPIPYRASDPTIDITSYFQLWDNTRQKLARQLGHAISLEIEPGRYLTAECGYLLTEIRAIKQMGENLFYLVDAGFNNLARPILYGAYHPMAIARGQDNSANTAEQLQDVVVGGPLCESGDIFTQEEGGFVAQRSLPQANVGDFLVIGCVGAYGHVMSSNYNSKPLCAEVLIENGRAHLVRQRQSFADMVRGESIPKASGEDGRP